MTWSIMLAESCSFFKCKVTAQACTTNYLHLKQRTQTLRIQVPTLQYLWQNRALWELAFWHFITKQAWIRWHFNTCSNRTDALWAVASRHFVATPLFEQSRRGASSPHTALWAVASRHFVATPLFEQSRRGTSSPHRSLSSRVAALRRHTALWAVASRHFVIHAALWAVAPRHFVATHTTTDLQQQLAADAYLEHAQDEARLAFVQVGVLRRDRVRLFRRERHAALPGTRRVENDAPHVLLEPLHLLQVLEGGGDGGPRYQRDRNDIYAMEMRHLHDISLDISLHLS